MNTSAQEATATVNCKIPGCANEALTQFGTYGLLCAEHKFAKRRELGLGDATVAPRPRPLAAVKGSREAEARSLVALGRKVDKARAKAEAAKRKLQPALDALREAEQEWQREVAALARSEASARV